MTNATPQAGQINPCITDKAKAVGNNVVGRYRPEADLNDRYFNQPSRLQHSLANPIQCGYCQRYESTTNCLDHDYYDRQRLVVRSVVSQ